MTPPRVLPAPPKVELRAARPHDEPLAPSPAFLNVTRHALVAERADGSASATFPYDVVERRALDAAVMLAHFERDGAPWVYLRSATRPPTALRAVPPGLHPALTELGNLWEAPAGLIEPGEEPDAAAARELEEELGFRVEASGLAPLGPPVVPAPGFIGEVQFLFHVRVDPTARRAPAGDGSVLERDAEIVSVPLEAALEACRNGEVPDAKTELALRRFADVVRAHAQERA